MTSLEFSKWPTVGRTANTQYFTAEPGLLIAMPDARAIDDGVTAAENVAFQNRYFHAHGPGVLAMFIDNLISQDKDARRVYQNDPEAHVYLGAALIGKSQLSKAIAAFFVGLAKPQVPLRYFSTLAQAMPWVHELLKEHRLED